MNKVFALFDIKYQKSKKNEIIKLMWINERNKNKENKNLKKIKN